MISRITALRFPLVVLIMYIHSYHPALLEARGSVQFARGFLGGGVATIAVPAFFLISGFLFFYGVEWSRRVYLKKLVSRLQTIVVPYLAWCLIFFLYMMVIYSYDRPDNGQFWYLQELMWMALAAPVLHWMHKHFAYLWLGIFLVVWLFFDWEQTTIPIFFNATPMLFFYAGSLVAAKRKQLFMFDKAGLPLMVMSAGIFALCTVAATPLFLPKLGILTGVVGVLYLSKFMVNKPIMWLSRVSFFLFCFHQPLMSTSVWRFLFIWTGWWPVSDGEIMAFYLLSPIAVVAIGIGLFQVLSKVAPRLLGYLTGRRHNEAVLSG